MQVYLLADKVSQEEFRAIPWLGALSFSALEEFVGGDAEYRSPEVVVATKQGALKFTPRPEQGATWIVEMEPDKFEVFTAEEAMAKFTPLGEE